MFASKRVLVGASLFVLSICVGYAISGPLSLFSSDRNSLNWSEEGSGKYHPTPVLREGKEMAFIYIGSSGYAPSNAEELPEIIKKLKVSVKKVAESRGYQFSAMGIAKDHDVQSGLNHLKKFGAFDQISVGKSWLNDGLRRYVWEDVPGRAATPQIVVVRHRIETPEEGTVQYSIRNQQLVTRKIGIQGIKQWKSTGVPVPQIED